MSGYRPISERIGYIYKKFYATRAEDRSVKMAQLADAFVKGLGLEQSCDVRIDFEKIIKLVDSYFLDVIRYKEYHFTANKHFDLDHNCGQWAETIHKKLINDSKVASFVAKWILMAKPIYLFPKDDKQDLSFQDEEIRVAVNELFAITNVLDALKINRNEVSEKDIDDLLYHFRFRPYNERDFFLIFETLQKNVELNRKVKMQNDKQFKIFVASPDDVSELRDITRQVIETLNAPFKKKGIIKYHAWFWEDNKKPGYLDNPQEYQNQVFKELGSDCDIFIMLLWHRYGAGTIQEYEHFVNFFRNKNPNIKFWMCRYGKPFPQEVDPDSLKKLNEWIKDNQDNWAPLGGRRSGIKNKSQYKRYLTEALIGLNS